jgi:hypothetical protein
VIDLERKQFEEIRRALQHVGKLCGFDNSESGSENFAAALTACAALVMIDVVESHDEGLCLDCYSVLADNLMKHGHEIRKSPI